MRRGSLGFKRRPRWGWALALVIAVVAGGCGEAGAPGGAGGSSRDGAVVGTDKGPLRGEVAVDHRTFRGIPYAAPPVGRWRWQAPQPVQGWRAVRDATKPASACPQEGFGFGQESTTEDCLYLNVTTPPAAKSKDLPVLVFLHGGDFKDGAGHSYGAERLATQGEAVVVTVNYRLGAFGFLAHPALDAGHPGASGNYGLQDQQAALRWVQRNAAAFGGNPGQVTLIGESAGGAAVCAHLTAPASAGLFHRAIIQSSPCVKQRPPAGPSSAPRPRDEATRLGTAIATKLGCTNPTTAATCLRTKPVSAIRAQSDEGEGLGPVFDTPVLPNDPATAVQTGQFLKIPVLHGINRHEERFMLLGTHPEPLTPARYRAEIERQFGDRAALVLDAYPCEKVPDCRARLAAVQTDAKWALPAVETNRALAAKVPTYAYEYADPHAPSMKGLPDPGFPLGAHHTSELPSLFSVPWAEELTPDQQRLSERMIGYWTRFARTGNPNGDGAPAWRPAVHPTGRSVLQLAPGRGGITPTAFARTHQYRFWSAMGE